MLFKKNNTQKMIEKRQKIKKLTTEISEIWSADNQEVPTDINGSYTGNPLISTTPEQDADDL